MRYTEYHAGKAVIKDKNQISEAMAKLAAYEDAGLSPQEVENLNTFDGSQAVKATIRLQEEQRKHRWISVSERLPEADTRVLVTIKHHQWISDYETSWVAEDEKTVHPEYTETCEAIYFENIGWEYRDMEGDPACSADYAFVDPEKDIASPVVEVLAWMPLPDPYKPQVLREAGKEAGTYADTQTLQSAT